MVELEEEMMQHLFTEERFILELGSTFKFRLL